MESYDILVIILSIALGISLIVWIVVGTLIIQVLRKLKAISETAQHTVDNVEQFTEHLKSAGKASAVGSTLSQISKLFKTKDK